MILLPSGDLREERIRVLLGLKKEAPDPNPAVWDGGEVRFLEGEELKKAREEWSGEDWRADLARFLANASRLSWSLALLKEAVSPLEKRLSLRKLRKTPYLVFLPKEKVEKEPWVIQGDLLFEGGSMPIVFIAAEGLAEHAHKESAGRSDYIFCEENDLLFEERWVVFPGRVISKEDIEKGITLWHKEVFRGDRHCRQVPRVTVFL